MYSILKRVNLYIRDFGIPFKSVCISSKYFPEYFNRVVLKLLNSKLPKGQYDKYIKEYILTTEGNGELKLIAMASNNKTTVVIFQDNSEFDYSINGYKVYESMIIEEAKRLERTSYEEIIGILKIRNLDERVNISMIPFEIELKKSAHLCIRYMDYCNKCYKDDMRNEEEISQVRFNTPETSTIIRSSKVNHDGSVERVNSIISVDERIRVLESYNPIYKGVGYSKNSHDIEYFNYLYDIGNEHYVIVMEPYSGNSATKVLLVNSEDGVDRQYFDSLVKGILSLSFNELCKRKDIIRLYHSTIDNFDDKLSVIIKGVSKDDNKHFAIRKKVNDSKK